jgi:hypothetical protein
LVFSVLSDPGFSFEKNCNFQNTNQSLEVRINAFYELLSRVFPHVSIFRLNKNPLTVTAQTEEEYNIILQYKTLFQLSDENVFLIINFDIKNCHINNSLEIESKEDILNEIVEQFLRFYPLISMMQIKPTIEKPICIIFLVENEVSEDAAWTKLQELFEKLPNKNVEFNLNDLRVHIAVSIGVYIERGKVPNLGDPIFFKKNSILNLFGPKCVEVQASICKIDTSLNLYTKFKDSEQDESLKIFDVVSTVSALVQSKFCNNCYVITTAHKVASTKKDMINVMSITDDRNDVNAERFDFKNDIETYRKVNNSLEFTGSVWPGYFNKKIPKYFSIDFSLTKLFNWDNKDESMTGDLISAVSDILVCEIKEDHHIRRVVNDHISKFNEICGDDYVTLPMCDDFIGDVS